MGNTLDAPITSKNTQTGRVLHDDCAIQLEYGVSSMQGWRCTMEDTHVIESNLYAEEEVTNNCMERNVSAQVGGRADGTPAIEVAPQPQSELSTTQYVRIPLPGHALFAVLDGHGGAFASDFASQNLYRTLRRHPGFVEYAKRLSQGQHPLNAVGESHARGKKTRRRQIIHANHSSKNAKLNSCLEDEDMLGLLKKSLRDTFVSIDREMLVAMKKQKEEGGGDENDPGEVDSSVLIVPADATVDNFVEQARLHRSAFVEDFGIFDAGTTICAVLFTPRFIVCANAGDCRAVLCRGSRGASLSSHIVTQLSSDHKPDTESEKERITKAGGTVWEGRVEGELAVSRGLGDFNFKDHASVLAFGAKESVTNIEDTGTNKMLRPEEQKVSSVPEIVVWTRDVQRDKIVIVACDGVWDVASNEESVHIVQAILAEGESDMGLLCEEILDTCLKKGSQDNMSVTVMKMAAQTTGKGGGVMKRRKARAAAKAEGHARRERSYY